MIPFHVLEELLEKAFREDIGAIDITTAAIVSPSCKGVGKIVAKEKGIMAGIAIAEKAFKYLDDNIDTLLFYEDGRTVFPGNEIMEVSGNLAAIITSERIALNILQHLSGIATQVSEWADEIAEFKAKIVDTRKTTPGLRALEKYAVRVGGGVNHRISLDSGILIKDNHIMAAGSITEAVRRVREKNPFTLSIEVEAASMEQVEEAISAGVHIIMLDNMSLEDMIRAVEMGKNKVIFEASGNITIDRIKEVAATGVDYISCGALTHSSKSLDYSFVLDQK